MDSQTRSSLVAAAHRRCEKKTHAAAAAGTWAHQGTPKESAQMLTTMHPCQPQQTCRARRRARPPNQSIGVYYLCLPSPFLTSPFLCAFDCISRYKGRKIDNSCTGGWPQTEVREKRVGRKQGSGGAWRPQSGGPQMEDGREAKALGLQRTRRPSHGRPMTDRRHSRQSEPSRRFLSRSGACTVRKDRRHLGSTP